MFKTLHLKVIKGTWLLMWWVALYLCAVIGKQNLTIMKKFKLLVVATLMTLGLTLNAQDRPMHEIHSMMVYNFMKYIEWPNQAKSGDFVIAVVGDKEVFNTFNSYYGTKKIGTQAISVKYFESVGALGNEAHLVYLAQRKSGEFEDLKSKLAGKSTLLITDKMGLGKKGSCINFKVVDNKLKFEINQEAFAQSNLKVSGALTSMAIVI